MSQNTDIRSQLLNENQESSKTLLTVFLFIESHLRMMRRKNTARPIHENKVTDNQGVIDSYQSTYHDTLESPSYSKERLGNTEKGGKGEFLLVSCISGLIAIICFGICIWLVHSS